MKPELLFQIITGVATFAYLILGLRIQNAIGEIKLTLANNKTELIESQNKIKEELTCEQTSIKEELVAAQNKVRAELIEHNNLLSQSLAVHIATDEVRFKQLENMNHVQVNVQK